MRLPKPNQPNPKRHFTVTLWTKETICKGYCYCTMYIVHNYTIHSDSTVVRNRGGWAILNLTNSGFKYF